MPHAWLRRIDGKLLRMKWKFIPWKQDFTGTIDS